MTSTSPQHHAGIMNLRAEHGYSPPQMNDLQHAGAFVVQFHNSTNFAGGYVAGRVEHIASGWCAHFASAQELLTIFDRVLNDTQSSHSTE
jgi:hypothetical protein